MSWASKRRFMIATRWNVVQKSQGEQENVLVDNSID
jgi:hypothetical protein